MSSVLSRVKQIPMNAGFYVTTASAGATSYSLTGTEVAPIFAAVSAASLGGASALGGTSALAILNAAGAILRDEGKTLRSAGRIFRKVQLLVSTGSILANGSDGVAGQVASGTVTSPYLTFYVELPGGALNGVAGTATTPIARLG